MSQSLSDTVNLIASVISILGGMISIGGVIYKWLARPGAFTTAKQAPPSPWLPAAPAPSRQPAGGPSRRPTAQPTGRGVHHPVIFGFSALGLLAVTAYSVELLVNYAQSSGASTGISVNSPLFGVNAVLELVNLVCVVVVTIGIAVTAYRVQSRGWLVAGVITLVVSLCTIGIFSVVALVPGVFYGLFGPREQNTWRA